eukprot:10297808-Alexandrium_andersonii.AAC.1
MPRPGAGLLKRAVALQGFLWVPAQRVAPEQTAAAARIDKVGRRPRRLRGTECPGQHADERIVQHF